MKLFLFFLAALFAEKPTKGLHNNENLKTLTGVATYYASYFNGRKTSSGEVFSNSKYTAAHRTLPFGTEVKVTNISNGKTVTVTVNDRGPFNKRFIIDLSQIAAKEIGIFGKGIGDVEITYRVP